MKGEITMMIIKDAYDRELCVSHWRNQTFKLTREEVKALLDGKMLGDPDFDEYGIFIVMEDDENDHS